jgi:hypothetical protein
MRVYKVLHPTDPKRHQGVTLDDVYGVIKPKRALTFAEPVNPPMPRLEPIRIARGAWMAS